LQRIASGGPGNTPQGCFWGGWLGPCKAAGAKQAAVLVVGALVCRPCDRWLVLPTVTVLVA
jgi:hypothetical protein